MYLGNLADNEPVRRYFSSTKSDGDAITMATDGDLFVHKHSTLSGVVISSVVTVGSVVCTTATVHGLATNDYVNITGALGMTELNGFWKVTVTNTTQFTLKAALTGGSDPTGSGWGTYTASSASTDGLQLTKVGITFTEDYLFTTGLHLLEIITTDAFYATGNEYTLILIGAVVDALTVSTPVLSWSVENRYMRGTDGANTVVPRTAQQNRDAMKLAPSAGAPGTGSVDEHLDNIPLTAMRGTDNAALASGVQLNAQGKLDVNAECDTALADYGANKVTPLTALQVNAEADTALVDAGVTATRMGYVDNLNIGGSAASSSEVTAISTNTRVRVVIPEQMQLPASGTIDYVLDLYIYDTNGNMEAPDSLPTITAANNADVNRSSALGTVTLVSTGVYKVTYTVAAADAQEQLRFEWSIVEGGSTTKHGRSGWVVDAVNVGFTPSDRSNQDAIKAVTDVLPDAGALTTIGTDTARLTATRAQVIDDWINGGRLDLIIDGIKAETASVLNDTANTLDTLIREIQGTGFLTANDSLKAIRDRGDAAWITGGGGGTDGDIVNNGTAQGGSISTITLAAGASAQDDNYQNDLIVIVSGTGAGQSEAASSYVGATKVVTMAANWKVAPDNTSVYKVYGRGTVAGATAPTTGQIADAVLNELMSGHDVTGSFAAYIRDAVERMAGNTEFDRTTNKLTIKNTDTTTRYALQTREQPGDTNVQEVVRTAS